MKLAAITGYAQCSKRIVFIKDYLSKLSKTTAQFLQLLQNNDSINSLNHTPIFFENSNTKKTLVILVGPTKDLASGIATKLKAFIPKVLNPSSTNTLDFILIGKGARKILEQQSFESTHYKIIEEHPTFNFHQSMSIAKKISNFITINPSMYKKCMILNMRFRSFFLQQKNGKILYPIADSLEIKKELDSLNKSKSSNSFLLEQDEKSLAIELGHKYLEINILYEMLESLTAENAARFVAMDKAATNAEKFISETTLLMNKARQVLITKQITEISCYSDI